MPGRAGSPISILPSTLAPGLTPNTYPSHPAPKGKDPLTAWVHGPAHSAHPRGRQRSWCLLCATRPSPLPGLAGPSQGAGCAVAAGQAPHLATGGLQGEAGGPHQSQPGRCPLWVWPGPPSPVPAGRAGGTGLGGDRGPGDSCPRPIAGAPGCTVQQGCLG